MRIGKLTNEQLKDIVLSKLHPKGDVLLRSGIGEDCAAIDFNGIACVMSTDPITGAAENIGKLAVNISCNDVATSGAQPSAMLVTMLIPPDKSISDIEKVIGQLTEEADKLGIDIIGGHTEITDAVNRIVVSTTVIGKVESSRIIKSSGAKPGDSVIMTGFTALEGTYIIANDRKDRLKEVLSKDDWDVIEGLSSKISVVEEGMISAICGATSMHDITEGGTLGAIYELCEASGTGCVISKEKIPILEVTKKICNMFKLDPYRLIGSGSMLITVKYPEPLIEQFAKKGLNAVCIGSITEKGVYLEEGGKINAIAPPQADELFSF